MKNALFLMVLVRSMLSAREEEDMPESESGPGTSRLRAIVAVIAALATWAVIVALASRVVDIPAGAYAFVLVFALVLTLCGRFLPLAGFGTGSFAMMIAVIA